MNDGLVPIQIKRIDVAEYRVNTTNLQDDFVAHLVVMAVGLPLTLITCIVNAGVDRRYKESSWCFSGILP